MICIPSVLLPSHFSCVLSVYLLIDYHDSLYYIIFFLIFNNPGGFAMSYRD